MFLFFSFYYSTATEIYTLSLHDALPICLLEQRLLAGSRSLYDRFRNHIAARIDVRAFFEAKALEQDRKSTRLNSSHVAISYAVFCLKKKKTERKRLAKN